MVRLPDASSPTSDSSDIEIPRMVGSWVYFESKKLKLRSLGQ